MQDPDPTQHPEDRADFEAWYIDRWPEVDLTISEQGKGYMNYAHQAQREAWAAWMGKK